MQDQEERHRQGRSFLFPFLVLSARLNHARRNSRTTFGNRDGSRGDKMKAKARECTWGCGSSNSAELPSVHSSFHCDYPGESQPDKAASDLRFAQGRALRPIYAAPINALVFAHSLARERGIICGPGVIAVRFISTTSHKFPPTPTTSCSRCDRITARGRKRLQYFVFSSCCK